MKLILGMILAMNFMYGNLTHSEEKLAKYSKYDHIFAKYEKVYGVSKVLMKTIAITENSKMQPKFVLKNTNNTVDVGLMQINSKWQKWMPEANITIEKLKDPDFNIKISFMIVRDLINRHGYSWETIGRYHSSTQKHKKKWLKRAKANIKMLASLDKRIKIQKNKRV